MAFGPGLSACGLVAMCCVLALSTPGAESPKPRAVLLAPQDPTDSELDAAGNGRTVRIGVTANGRRPAGIPLETYVARVLAGEGEPRAADGAQQALAIAIRTYVMANLGRHQREGFDLCDTTHCQVMRPATASSRRAAMATAGQMLMYEGHPAEVFYSASCGGRTEAGAAVWPKAEYPYLRSVKDDVHDDEKPWVLELSTEKIQQELRRHGFEGRLRDLKVESHSRSGRVATVRLSGVRPDEITGDALRAAIGAVDLRSTQFSVKRTSSGFRFTGTGFGHGVGMCVIGAGRRAARGESVAEILALYYPGLTLTTGGVGSDAVRSAAAVASAPAPGPAARVAPALIDTTIVVRGSAVGVERATVERLALAAHAELTKSIGASVAPIAVELHESLDSFRRATGRPWWVSAVASGTTIDLAPSPVLGQRDGLETAVRVALAETLIGDTLNGRPAWVRVGAARYFARAGRTPSPILASKAQCPTDAELTLAVSAPAQREAELRAEACFVRAAAKTRDWRQVR